MVVNSQLFQRFLESKIEISGQQNETLKELLEKSRGNTSESQQNIKIAFAEGYLAANSDNKDNVGGGAKLIKVSFNSFYS